jgi:hypothetical protein
MCSVYCDILFDFVPEIGDTDISDMVYLSVLGSVPPQRGHSVIILLSTVNHGPIGS